MVRDISLTEARDLCRRHAVATGVEAVPVAESVGRILAVDARALVDLPSGDCSAMDGWAVRAADTPGRLRVVGEHRAGHGARVRVGPGEAVRVSTGALMPEGAHAVARVEEVAVDGPVVDVPVALRPGRDVRRRGEVLAVGDVLLRAGDVVAPTAVTALGSAGLACVQVRTRPRVAVIATGDELVPLGEALRPGQVHDSNRVGVAAQVAAAGGDVVSGVRVPDDRAATEMALRDCLDAGAEVLISVGGVSVGPHDHMRPALEGLGFVPVFHRVGVMPCRPMWLGVREGVVALALPGNPVSAAVAFHLFGRVLLGRGAGGEHRAPLAAPRSVRPGMVEAVRCRLHEGVLHPLPAQGAHAIADLARADALALVEGDVPAGVPVAYDPLVAW